MKVLAKELHEAESLLKEVSTWTEEEVEKLPLFYKRKAVQYRQLTQQREE